MEVINLPKKNMKKIIIYTVVIFCFISVQLKSQSEGLKIQINYIPTEYTVTSGYDTTFAREVVINLNDTSDIRSMQASISLKTDSVWQTINVKTIDKSMIQSQRCSQVLCCYKRRENEWVIYIGSYSLFSLHSMEINFNLKREDSNYVWREEF